MCKNINSEGLYNMLLESHEYIKKDNKLYLEEYERLQNELQQQKLIWSTELEETKELIIKMSTKG